MTNKNIFKRWIQPERIIFLAIAIIGMAYIYYTWDKIEKDQKEVVMQLARSICKMIPKEEMLALNAKPDDIDKPEYKIIKNLLKNIIVSNNKARFAYLYLEREGKIYFIADSEPEDSKDYSPPGQEYTEAKQEDRQPFNDGKEMITDPIPDRWGTWVSVFIPIKDEATDKVIAVFGMDFNAKSWNHIIFYELVESSILIVMILLAFFFIIQIKSKNRSLKTEIFERKQVDEALLSSEIRMRSITDSAQDAILMMDNMGLVSYWNPAAERIFGYSSKEALGKNLHSLIAPKHYHYAHNIAFPIFLKTGEGETVGKTIDLEALRKDGSVLSVQLSLSSIKIKNNWHSVGIIRDISERKKNEVALIQAKEESELANKAKSIFLSNMSHEIRTPLNAIIGFSQLMSRSKTLTDAQKEYNSSIIRAGEHLLELINEILELSKIEAGRSKLNPSNIDLHLFSEDIHLLFKERAESKHLQLIFEVAEDLPQYIVIDESKLRQIFVNLIGNAIKFTSEGGVAVRIRVNRESNPQNMVVEIEDSGPGIPESEIGRLFKHFEQTSSGVKHGSGTGLGLALSRELAILMGGDITVSSQYGIGSIFTFQVEIKEGKEDNQEISIPKRVVSIDKGEKQYLILVVDDKKDNLQVVINLLQLVGFETIEAVNGEEAITQFEKFSPHLILMDMRMPVMDGYDATKIIKLTEKGKNTPIVALTASTFEEEKNRIEALNMQGYIRKPFRENELFSTIGKVLGISYIYEDEAPLAKNDYIYDSKINTDNTSKIPDKVVVEMLEAISVADLDKLIELIDSISSLNVEFSKYLMTLAKNYEYDLIRQIITDLEEK